MVTLYAVHTALKAHSIKCTVDGFGSGMGNGLHYIVNSTHYQQVYKALTTMGFTCMHRSTEERIYTCNNFVVTIIFEVGSALVIFNNTAAPTYYTINYPPALLPA